ncbi:MAG: regulatory protein RecX [Bifidobacterium psychraerophilum]|uniref:regulatory protein RecX n=1 Tax=Bifidobacterium psychraerophilum TaxID=218140 RepID=UPI0039E840BB
MISADEFLDQVGMDTELSTASGSSGSDAMDRSDDERFDACKESALRSLDAAQRSSSDLAKRLIGKGYEEETVDAVICRLQQLGLLDDEAYAEDLMRYCLQRDMGERGVRMEMSRKGVEATLAARLIEEAAQRGDFVDAAYELGRSVERRTHGLERKVRMRRLWSAGGRKGHSPDTLRKVFDDLFV